MVDLVCISYVKSLGLSPYKRHKYKTPILEGIGQTYPRTYGFYYLDLLLTDRYNRTLRFFRPFLAIDRDLQDSQILLGRPALKDLRITIDNFYDNFEFQRKSVVTVVSVRHFYRKLPTYTQVFQVYFRFLLDPDDDNDPPDPTDFSHIPERLHTRYRSFFSEQKAAQQPPHRPTDHAIELQPGADPPFLKTYNMSPRELEAL